MCIGKEFITRMARFGRRLANSDFYRGGGGGGGCGGAKIFGRFWYVFVLSLSRYYSLKNFGNTRCHQILNDRSIAPVRSRDGIECATFHLDNMGFA